MTFKYKISRGQPESRRVNRTAPETPRESLTGMVQGLNASDLEERFARALYRKMRTMEVQSFEFRPTYIAGVYKPGSIELDFLIYSGVVIPVQIDGQIGHKTAAQKAEDEFKDALLNDALKNIGAQPVIRIAYWRLETQEAADEVLMDILEGRFYGTNQ